MHFIIRQQDRVLGAALGLSLALHASLLAMHFTSPAGQRSKSNNTQLEVVLVNAKSRERPLKADVLAQANLNRGGTVEERRRAKTPLPVVQPPKPGKDLADAQRRQQSLEAKQQELLAQTRPTPAKVPTPAPERQQGEDQPGARPSGRDLADLELAAMRLQAQIARQIEEYQQRPRKKFIGANAAEYRFAQYEEDWRAKIERIGTNNYPAEARGKIYGNLRLTVTIRPDGSVESIELDRSSGLKVLDAAAHKIVRMATPFAAFPADIRRDTDLLVITRTWFFGQGDKIWTEH
jgi:periplasmic protein TonB